MPNGHILFIAPSAYPLGGVATWLDYIVPGLRKEDWQVTLGLTEGVYHDVPTYLSTHPFDGVVRITRTTGSHEDRVRCLCETIAAVGPDIVAGVNIGDVYLAVNRLKHGGRCTPHAVMTLHGIESDYYEQLGRGTPSLDAIVATNRLACKLATMLGHVDADRVYYAPYGVPLPASVQPAVTTASGTLRIAFVGRLERTQKRVHDIVAIVAELDRRNLSYELLIAGSGPEENWLRQQLRSAEAAKRVRFLGTVSKNELETSVYPKAHALLITSLWETGPIVAWEAMAHGVAVVTSAYIGMGLEGSLRHGENCLIHPVGDAASAADCLIRLCEPATRQRLIDAGLMLVRTRYSHEVSIKRWSQCFSEISAKPVRPAIPDLDFEPAGRLDRLLGIQLGETVRSLLGMRQEPAEAGAEWPHISVLPRPPVQDFWEVARAADRGRA